MFNEIHQEEINRNILNKDQTDSKLKLKINSQTMKKRRKKIIIRQSDL